MSSIRPAGFVSIRVDSWLKNLLLPPHSTCRTKPARKKPVKFWLELKSAHKLGQNYCAALSQQPLRLDGALLSLSASAEHDQGKATT